MSLPSLFRRSVLALAGALFAASTVQAAEPPKTITLDFATYNPVSLLLKDKGWAEEEFARDGIEIRWVQSAGSNKALEFLRAGSIDFGSTAGAAALLGRINGTPIRTIYVYSRPEWTALVTKPESGIKSPADLKGRKVAVTKGTDPYIFLLRALDDAGLTEGDIEPVLLQHADGAAALTRGDVDAWAGLDPIMARVELEQSATLFYRKPERNTYGVLNTREEFAAQHPDLVRRVLALYERARKEAIANPAALQQILATTAKITPEVAERQLGSRTDLTDPSLGERETTTLIDSGLALQKAGVIAADVDVRAAVQALIDRSFAVGG